MTDNAVLMLQVVCPKCGNPVAVPLMNEGSWTYGKTKCYHDEIILEYMLPPRDHLKPPAAR
jgi:hypothetical protein